MVGMRQRIVEGTHERAVQAGRVPRRPYAHYFIETEGLRSRVHLQNFYSTFWPGADATATAHVSAFDQSGRALGTTDVELPAFGSMFLEVANILERLGASTTTEGLVAVDLEPAPALRARMADLPSPESVGINTPFWMAYRDASENYMYVHSIEVLGGVVEGTTAPLAWHLRRAPAQREPWRSWRLLDADLLDEVQVVAVNHGTEPGETGVGIFDADGPLLWEERVTLAPRELRRVRVPQTAIEQWREAGPGRQVRIGLDPLLTTNGKPYVIMRYAGGPPSLHHG